MKAANILARILIVIGLAGMTSIAAAAPKSQLWERWASHDPDSSAGIDHRDWDGLLQQYVVPRPDGVNRFAYRRLRDSATDRERLRDYLRAMAQIEISRYNRDQQRAYWINLYNAITIDIVQEHYPIQSIRDIRSGLFSAGPWKLKLIEIEGEALTLDDIEHRILRPTWQDPRVHYAVNCASIGCPNLQNRAFTAANTENLLQRGAREFVNHPRGARVANGKLRVSSIYDWFEADFGGSEAGVIAHLRRYANGETKTALEGIERIDDDDYDWNINAAINPKDD